MWLAVARSPGSCLLLVALILPTHTMPSVAQPSLPLGGGELCGVVGALRLVQPVLSVVCVRLARKMRKQSDVDERTK